MTRRTLRTNPGRLALWHEAVTHLRTDVRQLMWTLVVLFASAAAVNVLLIGSPYLAGLVTGLLAATGVAGVLWRMWVTSGLSHRLMGSFAEEGTSSFLKKSPEVLAEVTNLRYEKRPDIDHVVVTTKGVLVLETKWSNHPPTFRQIVSAAERAAQAKRTLRLNINHEGLPDFGRDVLSEDSITSAVVWWGPGSSNLEKQRIATESGFSVVLPQSCLLEWIDELPRRPIGVDFAEAIQRAVLGWAEERDVALVDASRIMRYLARVR